MVLCLIVSCGFRSGTRKSKEQVEWENSKGVKTSFYRVPSIIRHQGDLTLSRSEERRRKWLTAISRDDLTEQKLQNDRVCSRHFILGKPSADYEHYKLDWVPTLHLGHGKTTSQSSVSVSERAARKVERRKRVAEIDFNERSAKLQIATSILPDDVCTPMDVDNNTEGLLVELDIDCKECHHYTEKYFRGDDKKTNFHTGLPTFDILIIVFEFVSPHIKRNPTLLSLFQEYVLVLMKLRQNLSIQDLAYRFHVSIATISRIFQAWITVLDQRLCRLILWPEREDLWRTMPKCFQNAFGFKTTVIIDCFEIFIEKPSNLLARAQTFSSYKHHNTIKLLIGITPQGTISFVSKSWGGRTSDKHLTENCGLLNYLKPGDMVMADRGFTIEESVGLKHASLAIPAFTRGKNQLEPVELEKTREIANVRIHVERVIGQLRQKYKILEGTLPIHYLMTPHGQTSPTIDRIIRVCAALINLCKPIVPFD